MTEIIITVAIMLVIAIVACVCCYLLAFNKGVAHRKRIAELAIGSAEIKAKEIVAEAKKDASSAKKEALVEAKDEIYKLRLETEKELKERRGEITRQERKVAQKEETLEKKIDNLEKKDEKLQAKIKEADEKLFEADEIKKRQFEMLERISSFTVSQAKEYMLSSLENELIHEKAVKLNQYELEFKDKADEKATIIMANAMQRLASDFVSENTVSVVVLPNDDMKGRIIGREGRNIRTLETLTGVDLIVDDTPEAITISSHNPIKREIARISIEKLITDGRIHPARIEETVEKTTKEIEQKIKQEGEKAVLETGIHAVHPEIVKLLGRLKYRTSYGQNVLNHSLEVAFISGTIAGELGADVNLARRAGLLHDIGKALNHEIEGSHVAIGVDVCKKYKEHFDVLHAIESHHGDVEAKTIIACIVQAADALSAARPGARRENLENYIKRLQKLEEIANSFDGVEKSYAIQAGREIRIMVNPDKINDDNAKVVAREIGKRVENELEYPGQIKIHVIRESRAIEFAK